MSQKETENSLPVEPQEEFDKLAELLERIADKETTVTLGFRDFLLRTGGMELVVDGEVSVKVRVAKR